jgi:hypothetical protein
MTMPFPGQTSQRFFYSSDIDLPVKLKMCVTSFPIPHVLMPILSSLVLLVWQQEAQKGGI